MTTMFFCYYCGASNCDPSIERVRELEALLDKMGGEKACRETVEAFGIEIKPLHSVKCDRKGENCKLCADTLALSNKLEENLK